MTLAELPVRRPVLATVMSIVILLFGVIGYTFLGVREYPAIDPPTISVRTSYTGANADIVESQITEPLEKAINGISGIRSISSSSALGNSNITVEFNLGVDLDQAANDVRDKVSQAGRNLPQDIDAPPVVAKADANGDPIIFMPVQSTTRNSVQLTEFAENVLQEKLQTIPGVSAVNIFGSKRPSMRLWIKPQQLAAYQLTLPDVIAALNRENVELPAGKVRGESTELVVKTSGRLYTEEDFNNLIISQNNQQVIRFRDIGEAVIGPELEETAMKKNNVPGVALALLPQPGANYIEIANEFYKRYRDIQKDLPKDIILDIGIDKTRFVRKAIEEVSETIFIAFFLVVIIVYLFFRDWVIAVRPLIDIPVSLIGAFFIMYVFGFSINILTLLAIVLATGLVVDDGIVVTENIFKKMEEGMSKMDAAIEGTKEIFFAVIATSITLAVVFIPVIFLQGFTGRLFREFGIVVAGAVLISAFVSLTLTPMLNVKLARSHTRRSRFYELTEPFFVGLEQRYRSSLQAFMRLRWLPVFMLIGCIAIIGVLMNTLQSELAPLEDRSIIRSPVTLPEGTDYDVTEQVMDRLAQTYMDSLTGYKAVFSIIAPSFNGVGATNSGFVSTMLKDPTERPVTQFQIYEKMNRLVKGFPEGRIFPNQEQTISTSLASGSQLPVQFIIQNLDFKKIESVLPKFIDKARKNPVFGNVDVNLKFNKPELLVSINRMKATDLGVSVKDISNTLQLAYSGGRIGYFTRNGKQYQVIGQVDRENRNTPVNLKSLYVRNGKGDMIQLDNLVTVTESSEPPTLFHYNRYKSATVSASLAPGKTLGEGIQTMRDLAKDMLDESFTTDLGGTSRDFAESSSNTSFAFLLALVLIYLILAAQFESFRDPLIIMFTVPLAIAGALLSLFIFDQTLNIFSQIGMIMLIGLVTKNGILIVEFANQKQENGLKRLQAVQEAAAARLRPILMTSLATILGAMPIALALGSGSRSRIPLGVVIVGGLMFSLLLTLYVIPGMYALLAHQQHQDEEV
ncbi:MAG: efflux RND transporter permease subunit [Chitinophagales bacterium]